MNGHNSGVVWQESGEAGTVTARLLPAAGSAHALALFPISKKCTQASVVSAFIVENLS